MENVGIENCGKIIDYGDEKLVDVWVGMEVSAVWDAQKNKYKSADN